MSGQDRLEIRLLGPVRALRGGLELPLGPALRAGILAVLALHAGHAVPRQQLTRALWGEDPPASAPGNLYSYVSALRRTLEPDRERWAAGRLLASGSGAYRLGVRPEDVDVFRFEALREQSRHQRSTGDPAAELITLDAAIGLWRGDALHGVPGPFAESQRLRLTELRLTTAERRASLLTSLGRPDEAVAALEELITVHPRRESLYGLLVSALRAAGRATDAPAVHDRLSRMRRDQTRPAPAVRRRAARGPGPVKTTSRPAPRQTPGLIGREAERRWIRRAVADAAAGRGGSIRLEGAPGMGRSALLAATVPAAAPAGMRIGRGTGDELARRLPLGVLTECLTSADPGVSRPTSVDEAVTLVRRLASAGPLVLIADDLQWADDATTRAWSTLHEATRELPLLLIAAVRSASREVRLVPADEVRTLPPLSPPDAALLVEAVAPRPLPAAGLGRIVTAAAGHPQYLRFLAAAGDEAPPSALTATVDAHLSAFSAMARTVLRACAFLGGSCTVEEVATAAGRHPIEVAMIIEYARTAGILVEDRRILAFRHPVVGQVLCEGTPSSLRAPLQRSITERLAAHRPLAARRR